MFEDEIGVVGDADAEDEVGDAAGEFAGFDAGGGDGEEFGDVGGGALGAEFEQDLILAGGDYYGGRPVGVPHAARADELGRHAQMRK